MQNIQVRKGELSQLVTTLLIVIFVLTFLAGLVYMVGQQILRMSANDPQIQMAEDAASGLTTGKSVQNVLPGGTVNIRDSLAPYLIIYDENGTVLGSSVQLDGSTPALPTGLLGEVRQNGEDRFTWQPASGVRSAAVLTHFSGTAPGFVLAGRSLKEVEKRENQLLLLVGAGWVAGCAVVVFLTFLRLVFLFRFSNRKLSF